MKLIPRLGVRMVYYFTGDENAGKKRSPPGTQRTSYLGDFAEGPGSGGRALEVAARADAGLGEMIEPAL